MTPYLAQQKQIVVVEIYTTKINYLLHLHSLCAQSCPQLNCTHIKITLACVTLQGSWKMVHGNIQFQRTKTQYIIVLKIRFPKHIRVLKRGIDSWSSYIKCSKITKKIKHNVETGKIKTYDKIKHNIILFIAYS
jgi:hypothetical protein